MGSTAAGFGEGTAAIRRASAARRALPARRRRGIRRAPERIISGRFYPTRPPGGQKVRGWGSRGSQRGVRQRTPASIPSRCQSPGSGCGPADPAFRGRWIPRRGESPPAPAASPSADCRRTRRWRSPPGIVVGSSGSVAMRGGPAGETATFKAPGRPTPLSPQAPLSRRDHPRDLRAAGADGEAGRPNLAFPHPPVPLSWSCRPRCAHPPPRGASMLPARPACTTVWQSGFRASRSGCPSAPPAVRSPPSGDEDPLSQRCAGFVGLHITRYRPSTPCLIRLTRPDRHASPDLRGNSMRILEWERLPGASHLFTGL